MPKRKPEPRSSGDRHAGAPALGLLSGGAAALVVMRLLTPPEASAEGGTIWIAAFWLLAGGLAAWCVWRGELPRRRWDRLDAGVWLVVAGHVISALRVVVWNDGERRPAITLAWEWVALGVSFSLLRSLIRSPRNARTWGGVLVSLAAATAGYGLWQRYVSMPAEVQWYDAVRGELDQIESASAPDSDSIRGHRMAELRRELIERGVPPEALEEPSRRQFEDRFRGSTEAIGLFALANTLGGWLAAWLVVAVAWLVNSLLSASLARTGRERLRAALPLAVASAVMAFCLFLTKSRTAWVGLAVGLAAWGSLRGRRGESPTRRGVIVGVAAAALVAGGLAAAATMAGGLDRDVVAQAPRSVRFRLQYWTGTLGVLRERWLWGTGPGNFRPHYLRHKLPGASEEIADPHNFVLDAWTSGGLLSVLGGALACAAVVRALKNPNASAGHETSPSRPADGAAVPLGALLGGGAMAVGAAVLAGDASDAMRLTAIAVVAGGTWIAIERTTKSGPDRSAFAAAALALLVHLLGAGGIEMPAIAQTLLLFAAAIAPVRAEDSTAVDRRRLEALALGTASAALLAGCLATAAVPSLSRRAMVAIGDSKMLRDGNVAGARQAYEQAAVADPFSAEPVERLAELEFQAWSPTIAGEDAAFERVTAFQELAIGQNPHHPRGYRRLGEMWQARYRRTTNPEHAAKAVEAFEQAASRYPASAAIRAELAEALAAAGRLQEAAEEAGRALRLDDVMRQAGHVDKQLPEALRERLKRLSNG